MKILDKNLKFSNLGEIYVGIKKGLINLEEALKLVENNKVLNLSEDDFKAIYSSDGNTSILQTIENRIKERKIESNETNSNIILDDFFRIWRLESLLKIELENKREILDKVYELFYYYDFLDDWALSKIILYSVDDIGNPLKEEDIYCNYLKFIDKEIDFFVSKNKQVEKF